MSDLEALIVGAGPTGLVTACALRLRGVDCRIIDLAEAPTALSRAIGVSARSLEILHYIGVADELTDHGVHCASGDFFTGGRRLGRIDLSTRTDTRFGYMLSLPQSDIERVLNARLAELGCQVERSCELVGLTINDEGCSATIRTNSDGTEEVVSTRWLIGADGSHSRVRHLAGITRSTQVEPGSYVIVDIVGESSVAARSGNYYFHRDGMALVAPLPDGSHRLAATVASEGIGMTLETVRDVFRTRTGDAINVHGLRDAGWGPRSVRVRTGVADTMRAGRCLIAGDAVHSYGPLGGQGMNGGIQDAYALAWRLSLVIKQQAVDVLLDDYQSERLYAAALARRATASQTRLATLAAAPARFVRDMAVRMGTATGILDRLFVPQVTQLAVTYATTRRAERQVVRRVWRLPDAAVTGPSGAAAWLHDMIDDTAPTVLLRDPAPAEIAIAHAALGQKTLMVAIFGNAEAAACAAANDAIRTLIDRECATRRIWRRNRILVLRPDRYVTAAASTINVDVAAGLATAVDSIFGLVRSSNQRIGL